jgi:hypothetical protein
MNLNHPVTVNLPAVGGTTVLRTVSHANLTLIDNSTAKFVKANLFPFYKSLTLWEKEAYDAIGDYTQVQAEARINELLGDDPNAVLAGLYHPNYTTTPQPSAPK